MWERNCFLTLTYDEENYPEDGKIDKTHIQDFIRSLRKDSDRQIRYFACGEYGEQTRRAHYHAIIFNEDFLSSHYQFSIADGVYGNTDLQRIWGKGAIQISPFNHARAKYTAGYVTKKINDTDTFSLMSTRPPLGRSWVQKYHDNLRRNERVVINGQELPIPRVYLRWLKGVESYDHIKENLRKNVKPINDKKLKAKRQNYLAQQNLRNEKV